MHQTIYVALMEEGTDVWRPVDAVAVGGDLYRLPISAPEDEVWEFRPGQVVRCETRSFTDQATCLVAVEAAN